MRHNPQFLADQPLCRRSHKYIFYDPDKDSGKRFPFGTVRSFVLYDKTY